MGEEQRAAQRIDLPDPIQAMVGEVAAKIVDISLVGCRIEHAEKLTMGSTLPLKFAWRSEPVQLTVKIARTELRSISGKMMYSTGVQFASSVDSSPEAVQRFMASLVKSSVAERPREEVPIFFERAPFFRDEEPDEPPRPPARSPAPPAAAPPAPARAAAPPAPARAAAPPAPARGAAPPAFAPPAPAPRAPAPPAPAPPAPAPPSVPTISSGAIALGEEYADFGGPAFELDFNPAATATYIDAHAEAAVATRSFELESDEVATVVEVHRDGDDAAQSFELELESHERYAQCTFENGKWAVSYTREPKQPRDGFTIVDPGDQREIDQFCRTYEYADPDTRRMIRVSCELMIAQQRGR